jgi:hypothetical protein
VRVSRANGFQGFPDDPAVACKPFAPAIGAPSGGAFGATAPPRPRFVEERSSSLRDCQSAADANENTKTEGNEPDSLDRFLVPGTTPAWRHRLCGTRRSCMNCFELSATRRAFSCAFSLVEARRVALEWRGRSSARSTACSRGVARSKDGVSADAHLLIEIRGCEAIGGFAGQGTPKLLYQGLPRPHQYRAPSTWV